MKTTFLLFAALFMWSCGRQASHNHNSSAPSAAATPVPTASIPRDGDYPGKGVVTKVDTEAGWVEIDHEAIEEVMPQKMKMMFNVKDKAILKGINAGDNVEFVLEYKHPKDTVKSIKKIP
jgi:Cu/Ag efflux protein CusF